MDENKKKLLTESASSFGHKLQIKFHLPPGRPSPDELIKIIPEVVAAKGILSTDELRKIVFTYVQVNDMYKHESLDLSDINDIIYQMRELLKG